MKEVGEDPTEFLNKVVDACNQLKVKLEENIQIKYVINGLLPERRKLMILQGDETIENFQGRLRRWALNEKIDCEKKKNE